MRHGGKRPKCEARRVGKPAGSPNVERTAMMLAVGDARGGVANAWPLRHRREGPFRAQDRGRGDWIRTSDLLNPIQVRYQAALRPDRFVLRMST